MSEVVNEKQLQTASFKPSPVQASLWELSGDAPHHCRSPLPVNQQLYTGKYCRENFEGVERELKAKLLAMGNHSNAEERTETELSRRAREIKSLNRYTFNENSPIQERVNQAIERLLSNTGMAQERLTLPSARDTLILDEPGMAYLAALPEKPHLTEGRFFKNRYVESYELHNNQGVLHNPKNDRRTSGKETFHIADTGYPVPYSKTAVPCEAAARILKAALNPPAEDKLLPYTKDWGAGRAELFVSLLVNPLIVPGVEGFSMDEYMETLVLAPGGMVSNLDFIERIFGNAGNQFDPAANLFLKPEHWTGDTAAIIFAPHLTSTSLAEMGIDPQILSGAHEGMEFYNDGNAFLLKIRDPSGVVITIIADNYFGLGKKTIMTDASFAADRRGLVLQEHAGGALVFPRINLGSYYSVEKHSTDCPPFRHLLDLLGDRIEMLPGGIGRDRLAENVFYVPETASFTLNQNEQKLYWRSGGVEHSQHLIPEASYFLPSGQSVSMIRERGINGRIEWKLTGTFARGSFIHKSDTVSGGGKSELSKEVHDLIRIGSLSVVNLETALNGVQTILDAHYPEQGEIFQRRFKYRDRAGGRPALDQSRTFGSVEKLLTPSPEYTDEYNDWLSKLPYASKLMVLHLHMVQSSGEDVSNWRSRFKVSRIDGQEGRDVHFDGRLMKVRYMRLGYDPKGEPIWSTLRPDFQISNVLKMEDDLSVSIIIPAPGGSPESGMAKRYVRNMESRFFNRMDEAKKRGAEVKAEVDTAGDGNYIVNGEPLPLSEAANIATNEVALSEYTPAQQERIRQAYADFLAGERGWFCVSDRARIVEEGGKRFRSPNLRYLEDDDNIINTRSLMLADIAWRLHNGVPLNKPADFPVNMVTPARRLNTIDKTPSGKVVPHIAVYPPLIMQETPELFMDLISSITGKSPSTTGGLSSEGAGTKGPFNCLYGIHYLNNQLKALTFTAETVITTAAERIGPNYRIGHDLSIMIKEVLARVKPEELKLQYMLKQGYLEPDPELSDNARSIEGGNFYRLTELGAVRLFGHIFFNGHTVFSEEQLKPELQSKELYIDGMLELKRQHREIALMYFKDGSIDYACPPLKALLHIMAFDEYRFTKQNQDGSAEQVVWTRRDPEFRRQFSPEVILESEWYKASLSELQTREAYRLSKKIEELDLYIERHKQSLVPGELRLLEERSGRLHRKLLKVNSPRFVQQMTGTIGADILPA